ncbi:sensor histidine kinase [Micromonospora sp. 067-2]|uniref:sensor histidine kinase n=1 Tax=Micromonospora sp. 067-2 TaxID=2789270 RepID=UPI00397CCF60
MRALSRPIFIDVLLATVLTGLALATIVAQSAAPIGWPTAALAALTVAPIALRQTAPVATMLVIVVALAAFSLLGYGELPAGGVGMVVAMITVATLRERRVAAAMFLAGLAVLVIVYTTDSGVVWSQAVQAALVLLGAWVLGEGTKRWAQRAARLAAQATQAVADERVRIARELHDIVAHHMSLISIQAGVAEYLLPPDLPAVKNAITTIGDANREALSDMRRVLHVLRMNHETEADFSPQPGLAQLDDLVDRTRDAGLPVEVAITGEATPLPPGPDLCAYRIVQESLTNVLKHAGPATAQVQLDYGHRSLTLSITDDGTGAGSGHAETPFYGIRGMRERAALYAGVLEAGPAPAGGFAVVLRLPVGGPT